MIIKTRAELVKKLLGEAQKIAYDKGKAYSDEDTLSNFKRNAERWNLTKYQVWGVYFGKHIDCIQNAIKNTPEKPIDKTEGLKNRIIDAINYLCILHCLLEEDNLK